MYEKGDDKNHFFKILQKFDNDVVLKFIRTEITDDEIIFIQSDNGELNIDEVSAFTRAGGIFQRFIHTYHPNMNGFVERAFRSIKELAHCMMLHAGLPDPYWEKPHLMRYVYRTSCQTNHQKAGQENYNSYGTV